MFYLEWNWKLYSVVVKFNCEKEEKMTPSEGIEPPASEPESEVLSITPRGHTITYVQLFPLYRWSPIFSTSKNQSLYLTITD